MVSAEVAEPLPTPIWMDRDGNECSETKALCCQVTHRLCHPEFWCVDDKVGGNISMKGDGNVGGQKQCMEQSTISCKKASHTDKRFTIIGLTSLDGKPVMCMLIIQGKEPNLSVETGIDVTINPDGKAEDIEFFFYNNGEGKYFPGGPVCNYCGMYTFENPTLQPTDMIPLINKAWKQSFARVEKNRNAIADRR